MYFSGNTVAYAVVVAGLAASFRFCFRHCMLVHLVLGSTCTDLGERAALDVGEAWRQTRFQECGGTQGPTQGPM